MSRRSKFSTTVTLKKKSLKIGSTGYSKNFTTVSNELLTQLDLKHLNPRIIGNLSNFFKLFLSIDQKDLLENVIEQVVPNIEVNDIEEYSIGDAEILLTRRLLLAFKYDCIELVPYLLKSGANPFRKGFLDNRFGTIFELIIDSCSDKLEYAKMIDKLILSCSNGLELENPLLGAIDLAGNKTNIKAVLKVYEKKIFG